LRYLRNWTKKNWISFFEKGAVPRIDVMRLEGANGILLGDSFCSPNVTEIAGLKFRIWPGTRPSAATVSFLGRF
jgi:hypothetical protein